MSSFDKLIQKILAGSQVSYKDVEKLMSNLGYTLTIRGSHHNFRKDGYMAITLKRRNHFHHYQYKDLQEVLKAHGYKKNI